MVGHCSNQIPQQPENEQQPPSIRWREIHYLYALPWGWSSKLKPASDQKETQRWCPNSWQPCECGRSVCSHPAPRSRGWFHPCSSGPESGAPPMATKASKKWPWLISLSFGAPLNEKPICYSIHSAPKSLTFSSAACQIKIMPLLTLGNFSAYFWPEFPSWHSFGVCSFGGFLLYKEFWTNALSLVICPYRLNLQPQIFEWVNPTSQDVSLYFNVWIIPKGV